MRGVSVQTDTMGNGEHSRKDRTPSSEGPGARPAAVNDLLGQTLLTNPAFRAAKSDHNVATTPKQRHCLATASSCFLLPHCFHSALPIEIHDVFLCLLDSNSLRLALSSMFYSPVITVIVVELGHSPKLFYLSHICCLDAAATWAVSKGLLVSWISCTTGGPTSLPYPNSLLYLCFLALALVDMNVLALHSSFSDNSVPPALSSIDFGKII